ncbi:N-acetyllactosaminide beta-1,6-N-acetylglucosaminyl-transferase [Holothuria leucospilota]|uniref:N-acetyllactosaminide beta-1,6-N-acetylglucosaminyl-transferase n=1 Tax=Holothuria leucospilota TaxID=206669 RepID=A0A9Q1C0A0_HOLLE|nr:N-acetyllactosaminide beta-1,6-N-acetylglucosaminyl-transferase [Holothuria leucospilota]
MQHSVINKTNLEVDEARLAGNILMPSDKDMANFTQDCSTFKHIRKYPTKPRSEEERNFSLAYIILTHKDVAQVERLLRAIYQPQNIYCIHPDKKSSADYQGALRSLVNCFENVFIPSKVEAVQYHGITRVQADINCMADLLEKPVQWKYVLNLCGQDFPLKTNLEIVQQLKAFKGLNAISGVLPVKRFKNRALYHHITLENGALHRTDEKKTPPPHNFTLYHGNAYIAATRAFTNYIINDQRAIDLLKWSEDTQDPEEHYYVTLQRYPGVPGGVSGSFGEVNVRFIKWLDDNKYLECIGQYVRKVCVFGIGYLNYLLSQPHLFANKFYYDNDPVTLQCLEEMLDYRQRYPKSIHQFVPEFPVVSLPWQNLDNF